MSRFFVVSALHLRNRAAGSSARRHMTSPVCGGADCRTKYRGSALCTVCRRVGAAGSQGNCKPAAGVSAAFGFHREIGNGVSGVNIYLASPFFNETERKNHDAALAILREKGVGGLRPSVASARQGKCFAENMGGSDVPGRCRRDPALRSTRASLLRAVFGQRHSVGMRLRVCFGQKDRCVASARRKVELHD